MDTGLAFTNARLRGVHDGDAGHGPATLALLKGVSAADAATRPVDGATLEGVVAHHAYHAGQIALMKRALATRRR